MRALTEDITPRPAARRPAVAFVSLFALYTLGQPRSDRRQPRPYCSFRDLPTTPALSSALRSRGSWVLLSLSVRREHRWRGCDLSACCEPGSDTLQPRVMHHANGAPSRSLACRCSGLPLLEALGAHQGLELGGGEALQVDALLLLSVVVEDDLRSRAAAKRVSREARGGEGAVRSGPKRTRSGLWCEIHFISTFSQSLCFSSCLRYCFISAYAG